MKAVTKAGNAREASVLAALPHLADYRTVLYIGANRKRFHLYGFICDKEVTVLEVFPPYCEALRRDRRRPVARVICGDVRNVGLIPEVVHHGPYELVVWWHGPEHVTDIEAAGILDHGSDLDCLWSQAILLGVPWGKSPQEPIDGNEHQAHRWAIYPEWFHKLGYQTLTVGQADRPRSHITAWRTA